MSKVDLRVGDSVALLITQLKYDRADVALISSAAASVMDLVIRMVEDAVSEPNNLETFDEG